MKTIGWFTSWVVMVVLGSMLDGFALSVMWGWFIVPMFNLPVLSIPNAIGISLIVGYMTKSITLASNDKRTSTEKFVESLSVYLTKPAIGLVFGWVITLFV